MCNRFALAVVILLASVLPAAAAPIELTSAQWATVTAGLPTITEDFESFGDANPLSPFVIANGSYSSPVPRTTTEDIVCGPSDTCLVDQVDPLAARTFSAFPTGTTLWASLDTLALNSSDVFQITVVGVSGTTIFTHTGLGSFVGFQDPLGLVSVSFVNQGRPGGAIANYSFDDVTTAGGSTTVPEPASLTLLGFGLAGLGTRRWRQRHNL